MEDSRGVVTTIHPTRAMEVKNEGRHVRRPFRRLIYQVSAALYIIIKEDILDGGITTTAMVNVFGGVHRTSMGRNRGDGDSISQGKLAA